MNRHEKEQVISSLKKQFTDNPTSFVVGYQGLSVAEVQNLRRKLRTQGGTFKVVKARLMKRAAEGVAGMQDLTPYFKTQVGLIFGQHEAALAKTLMEFAKDHKALTVIVGCADQQVLDSKTIIFLATLPSREVLLAQLCGVLQAPVAAVARVLQSVVEKSENKA